MAQENREHKEATNARNQRYADSQPQMQCAARRISDAVWLVEDDEQVELPDGEHDQSDNPDNRC